MLKLVFVAISVAFTNSFASVMPSVVVKDANCHAKPSRAFWGKVEEVGFWQSLRSEYKYFLRNKEQCVALDFNEKIYSPEILRTFVGKEVVVKGAPQYINREPFMVVKVDDVSAQ